MKKAIIVTLTVFVISAIVTVCLAVGLGANAFKEVFDNSGSFAEMLDNFEDRFDSVEDGIEDRFDPELENKENIIETLVLDGFEFNNDTVRIGCDAAEIIIIPSSDEKLSAKTDIYSFKEISNEYDVHKDYNGYDIYITKIDGTVKSLAKATVYIPGTVKNIVVESDVADVKINNMTFADIDISVGAGEVEIENTTVDNCNITVNTGEVELDNNFKAEKSLNVEVNTGEISYKLPHSQNAVINYSVNTGSAEAKDGLSGYKAFDSDGNAVTVIKRSGKLESESGTENAVTVNFDVNVGEIDFKQFFG